MSYAITKSFKRIKQNIKHYAFILAQVIVGILLLTMFLTINTSVNKEYNELKNKSDDNIIKLNMAFQKDFTEGITLPSPFSYKDYQALKSDYKESVRISYVVKKALNFITNNKGETGISTIYVIFLTDEFLQLYYPKAKIDNFNSQNISITGNNALNVLKYGKMIDETQKIFRECNTDEIALTNGNKLKLIKADSMSGFDNKQVIFDITIDSQKINLDDVVMLPIKYLTDFKIVPDAINTFVSFKLLNSNSLSKVGIKIINYLYSKGQNNYDYFFDTTTEGYLRQTSGYKTYSIGLTILSVFILLIIIVGLTGILLIIINRRIREYAISMTLGATSKKLFFETILESTIVTFLGGVIGVLICILIFKYVIKFKQFNVYIDTRIILLSLFASVMIGIVASLLPLFKIKQITPMAVLRSL